MTDPGPCPSLSNVNSDSLSLPEASHGAQQERSRRTLERILVAAEELLRDRDFDELTMADLAAGAGCAVGTLYRRIPDKESLLACLYERLQVDARTRTEAAFRAAAALDLEGRVRALCALLVEVMVEHRGVNRAVSLHLWSRAGEGADDFRRAMTASFRLAVDFAAACADEIDHPDPRAAVEFGLLTVFTMAQDRLVFGDRSGLRRRYAAGTLEKELGRLLLGYLCRPFPRRKA